MSDIYYPQCLKWLPSVKANGFRCTGCGATLWNGNEGTHYLFLENKPLIENPIGKCRNCGNVVLMIK